MVPGLSQGLLAYNLSDFDKDGFNKIQFGTVLSCRIKTQSALFWTQINGFSASKVQY